MAASTLSHKPILYGPLRDNAPNRIPRPPLAIHKDFFAGFCCDQVTDPSIASTTTKNTYVPHVCPSTSLKESKSAFLKSSKFDKQVHFDLGHSDNLSNRCRANEPLFKTYTKPACPIIPTNLYPPLFRDESLTQTTGSEYNTSFQSSQSQASARMYKGKKVGRPVSISFGTSNDVCDQSVTHQHFPHVPIDGQQFASAREIARRQARPAIVLASPEFQDLDRRSVVQSSYVQYGSNELIKPDLGFKANLVATHLSLASDTTSNKDTRFTSQYKNSFDNKSQPNRVLPIITPAAQLLNESNDQIVTTSQNAFVPHKVQPHRPIHRIDESNVFTACNYRNDLASKPKELSLPSPIHSSTNKDQLNTFQHVMHIQDQSLALSKTKELDIPNSLTNNYITGRKTSKTLKTLMNEAHWHTSTQLPPTETTYAHHLGTSATLANQLTRSQPLAVDMGLRRIPVLPDYSFHTSLHNTMHSDNLPPSFNIRSNSTSNRTYGSSLSEKADAPRKCMNPIAAKFLLTNQFDQHVPWISTTHRVHIAPQ